MKCCIIVLSVLLGLTHSKVLPEQVSNLLCRKSDPEYEKCARRNLEKTIPRLAKGVPEMNMPPMDPLNLPIVNIDRTINDLVSIKAILRNVNVLGASNIIIEDMRADPLNLSSEIRVTMPEAYLEMDYDVNGQLLVVPLRSKGHFKGNFSNTQIYAKGNLKTIDKDGVKYFKVDKYNMKTTVGDGKIQLTADNPNLQFGADLIANFFNGNPRRVMDAINPIVVEYATELYRVLLDQVLATTPAKEWLPE